MKTTTIILSFIVTLLISSNTFASSWAIGHAVLRGNTKADTAAAIESATRLSLEATKAAMDDRDQICIGNSQNRDDTHLEQEGNTIKVYTFYSLQDASCKQISPNEDWVRDQVGRMISML